MIKVGIIGITGRMGKMIASEINENEDTQIGTSCSKSGGSVEDTIKNNDVIIDFSVAQTSVLSASLAAKYGKPIIIGATGISLEEQKEIQKSAVKTAIVLASNMSLGVNLMFALTRKVAKMLDSNYDIEILEMHHNKKKDAPSGTALTLGKMAAEGRGVDFETHKETSRDGLIGERKKGNIGLAVLRGGNIPGEHKVIFAGEDEVLEITHKAASRKIFAKGAVKAALWALDKKPGLYSMLDVLDVNF